MAVALPTFAEWLGDKLKALNTDEDIFGDYITGILAGDDTAAEKNEALRDLLAEIAEEDQSINDLCTEIINMWTTTSKAQHAEEECKHVDVDIQLKALAEKHCLHAKEKQYSDEEKKIREAILAQYGRMSDDDEGGNEDVHTHAEEKLEKNTNVSHFAQLEKEKRETARLEAQKKKEKDKEDREKQKQLKADKKEKRKTQKGERRR